MEYLMTYGWAILIIAVVLGVLFQLGVFSSSSFSVRAPAGACQVLKTTASISLVGQCSGILPQYVGAFSGTSASKVSVNLGTPLSNNGLTVSAWAYVNYMSAGEGDIVRNCCGTTCAYSWSIVAWSNTASYGNLGTEVGYVTGSDTWSGWGTFAWSKWTHFVMVYNRTSGLVKAYINGTSPGSATYTVGGTATDLGFTIGQNCAASINGLIANVQLYNTTLSTSEVQSLYSEGIGGAPVIPSKLVGWWPLNGDAKDYGGGNGNGAATSVSYSSQWPVR
jgi:hypothetical protein